MDTKNNKTNIRVIVDQDSTLIDIVTPWMKLIGEKLNHNITKNELTKYDLFELLQERGVPTEQAASVFDIFADPEVDLYSMAELEPTYSCIYRCMLENPDVKWSLFTKSASDNMTQKKIQWMDSDKMTPLFDDIHIDQIEGSKIIRSDKAVEGDIIIDDHRKYCDSFIQKNPHGIAFQISQPWNRSFEDTEQIITVNENNLYEKLTERIKMLRKLKCK